MSGTSEYEMYVNGRRVGRDTFSSEEVERLLNDAEQNRTGSSVHSTIKVVTHEERAAHFVQFFRPPVN